MHELRSEAAVPARVSIPPSQTMFRRLAPKLAVSLLLGGLFAWLAVRGGVPLIPPREAFDAVIWWTVPAYVVVLLLTHLFRATRWRFLIAPVRKVPLREVIAVNWIGAFAIFALPLRLGELARPALSKMRYGISISVGLGTVAVERVIDGLITSLCVAWALFVLPRGAPVDDFSRHLPLYGYLSLAVFSSAMVALAMFLWQRELTARLTESMIGVVSPRLGKLIATKVANVADGIRSIGDAKLAVGFLFESLLYWAFNAGGMWLLGWGCGLPLDAGHAIAVMGILAIGILLPAGPGLFGNFQFAISAALKLYFVTGLVGTQGAVYIFLMYIIQAVVICLAGIIPLYTMHVRLSDLMGTGPKTMPPPAEKL